MLEVAAYTPGSAIPSARFRVRQYINLLCSHGIAVTEHIVRFSSYAPPTHLMRQLWAGSMLALRVPAILSSYCADVTLLQRFFLSEHFTLEGQTRRPRVLDVDDAIFIRGGKSTQRLAWPAIPLFAVTLTWPNTLSAGIRTLALSQPAWMSHGFGHRSARGMEDNLQLAGQVAVRTCRICWQSNPRLQKSCVKYRDRGCLSHQTACRISNLCTPSASSTFRGLNRTRLKSSSV